MNSMKNLRIQVNGMDSIWYYGHPEVRNYHGNNSSLAEFNKIESYNKGLYSLEGFVSLDDTNSLRFDYDGTVNPVDETNKNYIELWQTIKVEPYMA